MSNIRGNDPAMGPLRSLLLWRKISFFTAKLNCHVTYFIECKYESEVIYLCFQVYQKSASNNPAIFQCYKSKAEWTWNFLAVCHKTRLVSNKKLHDFQMMFEISECRCLKYNEIQFNKRLSGEVLNRPKQAHGTLQHE